MTQIKGYVAPTRRPGELGVHSMNQFNLAVPDMTVAENFYKSFGLDVRQEGNSLGLYTHGHSHRWGAVWEGPKKAMQHLSFGLYEDDASAFRKRLEDERIELLSPPKGFESNGLWFRDHDGNLVEVRVTGKTSPADKSVVDNASTPAGVRTMPGRSAAPPVKPRRLAHVLLFTRDVEKAVQFYSRIVGLRLSDRSADIIAFMHGIHGSDHHMVAFAKSDAPGLHHCSWDVASINDIGLGAMQMADKGFSAGWGMGRHVLGSNYFHYVRDPWGSYCEYSSDIDFIRADQDWDTGDHPGHDSIFIWGPTPPQDFVRNYEGEA